ncbi:MAG: class I SAM-dependent methyltransferase [Acidobacteriia bacterium]|nr:class I SAM-dependent methyltransferase [Terriglobia bacterium]
MSASRSVAPGLPDTIGLEPPGASQEPVVVGPRQGYERWAASYDQYPNPLIAREERYLMPLLPDLTGKDVLDLACGTGRWLQKLLQRGARLGVGIDYSAAMLRVASRKAAIRAQVARADCLQLPFRASVFDFAICSFALSHIQGWKQVARELARVMKPDAVVVISDLHPEAYARGWRTGFRDSRGACQIEMLPPAAEEIILGFYSGGFECLTHVPLCLGDPEKQMFGATGKGHFFAEAVQVPAVLVCHFRRRCYEDRGS